MPTVIAYFLRAPFRGDACVSKIKGLQRGKPNGFKRYTVARLSHYTTLPPAEADQCGVLSLARLDNADDRAHLPPVVRAAKRGRVQARDIAIQKQGIGRLQHIAEQPPEFMEGHRVLRNGKDHAEAIGAAAHPVADVARGAVLQEPGV